MAFGTLLYREQNRKQQIEKSEESRDKIYKKEEKKKKEKKTNKQLEELYCHVIFLSLIFPFASDICSLLSCFVKFLVFPERVCVLRSVFFCAFAFAFSGFIFFKFYFSHSVHVVLFSYAINWFFGLFISLRNCFIVLPTISPLLISFVLS